MLRKILPHSAIVISMMYLVFFCIDKVNSAMAFINNSLTKVLLLVLCAVSVINALMIISDDRKKTRMRQRQARQREAARREQPHADYARQDYRRYR